MSDLIKVKLPQECKKCGKFLPSKFRFIYNTKKGCRCLYCLTWNKRKNIT